MKKQLFILLSLIALLVTAQVPQRFNKVIVTGDIVSPKFIKTGSTVDSVLLGNGSARSVNSIKTDTINLSNRINAKATGNGTANGTNTGDETLTSIKTKLGAATSASDGYLKYQDFVKFDGKLSSEVDGSTTNELQTISTNGAAGNITLSNSGGTLNLNVNDADASPTNEIQDLSLSGNTLTLSSDATTVDVSQATAVLANTAKVSNATHTGDVAGSTALTLATVNSNIGTFNNVTINAKGLATAGSNVSYEPSFSKNTAFNKNFGTTPGTVLEGRTFGTAANSAVGDFQPIENQRLSTANSPSFNKMTSTVETGVAPLTVNSTTMVGNLNSEFSDKSTSIRPLGGFNANSITGGGIISNYYDSGSWVNGPSGMGYGSIIQFQSARANRNELNFQFAIDDSNFSFRNSDGTNYSAWKKLYHSGNLTSSLTANYIPKWNGSSFVNSLVSDLAGNITVNLDAVDGRGLYVYSAGANNDPYIKIGRSGGLTDVFNIGLRGCTGNDAMLSLFGQSGSSTGLHIMGNGDVKILTTTSSTSPTTGALVVNGGIGVGGDGYFGEDLNIGGIVTQAPSIIRFDQNYPGYETWTSKIVSDYAGSMYNPNVYHGMSFIGARAGFDNFRWFDSTPNELMTLFSTANLHIGYGNNPTDQGYKLAVNGTGYFNGKVTAGGFVKSGGTSSQFLKANGSVDATNYQPAITLTTNGTSGAATFSGGVLNVPNYVGSGTSSGIIPVTVISSSNSYTITNSDCWITYTYDDYPSITLPSTRIIGKIFYFRSASTRDGTIYGNGANILSGTSSSPSASSRLGARFTCMILWDGTNWQMSSTIN